MSGWWYDDTPSCSQLKRSHATFIWSSDDVSDDVICKWLSMLADELLVFVIWYMQFTHVSRDHRNVAGMLYKAYKEPAHVQ